MTDPVATRFRLARFRNRFERSLLHPRIPLRRKVFSKTKQWQRGDSLNPHVFQSETQTGKITESPSEPSFTRDPVLHRNLEDPDGTKKKSLEPKGERVTPASSPHVLGV